MSSTVSSNPLDMERVREQMNVKAFVYKNNEKYTESSVQLFKMLWSAKKEISILDNTKLKDVAPLKTKISTLIEEIVMVMIKNYNLHFEIISSDKKRAYFDDIVQMNKSFASLVATFKETETLLREKKRSKEASKMKSIRQTIKPTVLKSLIEIAGNSHPELESLFAKDSYTKKDLYRVLKVPL